VATFQVVERFITPENLRKLSSWAGNPHCRAEPLTLTALRILSLNEIAVIEDDLQMSLTESEKDKDVEAETEEMLALFLRWAVIPLDFPDFEIAEALHTDSCETPQTTVQDSERTLHSAPLPTQVPSESRFQDAVHGNEHDNHASSADGAGGTNLQKTIANGGASSPPTSKRAWTAIQNGVRSGVFFAAAAAVLKREALAQEQEHHIAKVQEWLSEPISKLELAPRPWTVMRHMASGSVECISHEPHSMVLRPGSETIAEILVAGSRSEMIGALKRVQKADQRELQRLTLAEQVAIFSKVSCKHSCWIEKVNWAQGARASFLWQLVDSPHADSNQPGVVPAGLIWIRRLFLVSNPDCRLLFIGMLIWAKFLTDYHNNWYCSLVLDAAQESKRDSFSSWSTSESDLAQPVVEENKNLRGQSTENAGSVKPEFGLKLPASTPNASILNTKIHTTWRDDWEMHYLEQTGKRWIFSSCIKTKKVNSNTSTDVFSHITEYLDTRCCLLRLGQISKIISRDAKIQEAKIPVNPHASELPVTISINMDGSDCFSVCPPPYPFGFELVLRRPLPPKNLDIRHEGITLRELIQRGRLTPSMRAGTPRTRPGSTGAPLGGSKAQVSEKTFDFPYCTLSTWFGCNCLHLK
jgi:hypothetical protein